MIDIYRETLVDDRTRSKRNTSPGLSAEHRVRQMVDRLESSSSTTNAKTTRRVTTRKSGQDDQSDGSISITTSPPNKRVTRRENFESGVTSNNNGGYIFRYRSPNDDVYFRDENANVTRFELNRDEILNGGQRSAIGTTVSKQSCLYIIE